jgi:cob(I)alamin adenosyltransferase
MKIYTGTGDRGKTSLFSGERVSKSDRQVAAYGDVDELSSLLGVLAAGVEGHPDLVAALREIQSDLFYIGAWLATTPGSSSAAELLEITPEKIHGLEKAIDAMEADLDPLTEFILPGGHLTSALAHTARAVCRRAERRVVAVIDAFADSGATSGCDRGLMYLNRLSDYLFVFARHCNRIAGVADIPWRK